MAMPRSIAVPVLASPHSGDRQLSPAQQSGDYFLLSEKQMSVIRCESTVISGIRHILLSFFTCHLMLSFSCPASKSCFRTPHSYVAIIYHGCSSSLREYELYAQASLVNGHSCMCQLLEQRLCFRISISETQSLSLTICRSVSGLCIATQLNERFRHGIGGRI